jgi:hypothetical protein
VADKKTISRWKLVANGSWLAGQEFPVHEEGTILGRSKICDVTIPGTHLSRQHVLISPQDGQLRVRDLESANGTFINEERITEALAKPGDILRLDVYTFRIVGPQSATGKQKAMPRGAVDETAAQALENIRNMKKQEKDYSQTEWVTKPTSIGNRTHNVPSGHEDHGIGFWLTIALGLTVVAGLAYYFVS